MVRWPKLPQLAMGVGRSSSRVAAGNSDVGFMMSDFSLPGFGEGVVVLVDDTRQGFCC